MSGLWSLRDGARVAWYARADAWSAGYILGVYGSTLKGHGRDLDMIAVPWRPGADMDALIHVVERAANARLNGAIEACLHGKRAVILVTDDGKIIDLQVRPAADDAVWEK